MWCWRRMQRISWVERKENLGVLETVDEKRLLVGSNRERERERSLENGRT